jgi:hypothetical protein
MRNPVNAPSAEFAAQAVADAARHQLGLDLDPNDIDRDGVLTDALLNAPDRARTEAFVAELAYVGIDLDALPEPSLGRPPAGFGSDPPPAGLPEPILDDEPSMGLSRYAAEIVKRVRDRASLVDRPEVLAWGEGAMRTEARTSIAPTAEFPLTRLTRAERSAFAGLTGLGPLRGNLVLFIVRLASWCTRHGGVKAEVSILVSRSRSAYSAPEGKSR